MSGRSRKKTTPMKSNGANTASFANSSAKSAAKGLVTPLKSSRSKKSKSKDTTSTGYRSTLSPDSTITTADISPASLPSASSRGSSRKSNNKIPRGVKLDMDIMSIVDTKRKSTPQASPTRKAPHPKLVTKTKKTRTTSRTKPQVFDHMTLPTEDEAVYSDGSSLDDSIIDVESDDDVNYEDDQVPDNYEEDSDEEGANENGSHPSDGSSDDADPDNISYAEEEQEGGEDIDENGDIDEYETDDDQREPPSPLEAHMFDWFTTSGLTEGITHLPLDDETIQELISGPVVDQLEALIEHYPLSELKSVLISLYQVAQLDLGTLKLKSLARKVKLGPVLINIVTQLYGKNQRKVGGSNSDDES